MDKTHYVAKLVEDRKYYFISRLRRFRKSLFEVYFKEKLLEKKFSELLRGVYKKFGKQVVVLIDEYDKTILNRIEERDKAREIRNVLKSFYSVLKPLYSYLKFVFITGVTKFYKVFLFFRA